MAKNSDAPTPTGEQQALVKGKTPRNAIMSIGIVAAAVIGGLGFFYELKASHQHDNDLAAKKAQAPQASAADTAPDQQLKDIDAVIRQQRADAEASARASAVAAAPSPNQSARPALTAADFADQSHGGDVAQLAQSAHEDSIYTSSVFRTNGAPRSAEQTEAALPSGIPSLADMRSAQKAPSNSGADAVALALAKQGQAPEDRDKAFLKEAAAQNSIDQTTFNGQARGCTLTPPHNIHVKTVEGLNSDKPGRIALMVDEDVYDSVNGDCLMIPKGSFINGVYSADVKVGQERLLVATTNLRLPNGKSVPLNGMQGADQNGYAGFSGDVNNHFIKIFGASFITAILLKAFDSGSQTATTASPNGVTTYGDTAGQVAATTAQAVLQRNQNIPPTITDPPGKMFLVQVTQDIVMEPYHD
ncbi:TrbI/VirB10 family protein [Burkholderia sp. S171]|uniref:TrbI/VirB10 family protein n=1 Tax=Burkholderia sp. S171 TaxID=1641860 RepID=UPI00131AFA37|nr:TrbI/VirB10 family protein [Burkholderia sp. S171]